MVISELSHHSWSQTASIQNQHQISFHGELLNNATGAMADDTHDIVELVGFSFEESVDSPAVFRALMRNPLELGYNIGLRRRCS
uniref:Uncharacterized protein n=1 Tax=Physcomitrium patens TaxID=3218 RepID=A0A2K1IJN8_PHYPA|nr:hypothetical protein PHYPA_028187 [Physcomitrium patens]